jgi:ribonuclease BN (tRNA processing enzyme)
MANKNAQTGWQGKRLGVKILHSSAGVAQQIYIISSRGGILIDSGDGTLRDILATDINTENISGIIFTHGHFDHMGGLYPILGFLRMIGREKDLIIAAPQGCHEVTSVINAFEKNYSDSIPFKIVYQELMDYQPLSLAGMIIKPVPVVHHGSLIDNTILNRIPAVGYRITLEEETIAISGDTGYCESLIELVKDADLALVEATYHSETGKPGEIFEKVHLSESLAKQIGRLAKNHILIHRAQRHA